MDTVTLVSEQIRGGERLLDLLAREGVPVRVAGWVKPVDEDRWSLYVATPLVDSKGPIVAYRDVYRVLRALDGVSLRDHEVKLIGADNRVARDLLEAQPDRPSLSSQMPRLTSVGGTPVEDVYVYPPPRQKSAEPKQSVLRFVLRTTEHPTVIMNRFFPEGKAVLNRTAWRGKGPRTCGISALNGRAHAAGSSEPVVYDIEVAYRPKGCITYSSGTRYDGWTAVMLDRDRDGTLLDGEGNPLPQGHPPVYRRFEAFGDADFNLIDFGEYVGEFEVEGVKRVAYEDAMGWIFKSGRINASIRSTFVAPRRSRPQVKIALTSRPSNNVVDGFGTAIRFINNTTPQLQQVLLDQVTEVVNGFVEGKYSIKSTSSDEWVLTELDDLLVDCTPNDEGKESRFNCLREYLPDSYLDELAMRLAATYEVYVSVIDGPHLGLLFKIPDRSRRD